MAENPEDLIVTDAELRRQLPALAKELKIGGGSSGARAVSGVVAFSAEDQTLPPFVVATTTGATVEGVTLTAGQMAAFWYLNGAWHVMVHGQDTAWRSTAKPDTRIAVTPAGPTFTNDTAKGGGTWTTPAQTGVTYTPASGTASPGQTVTVTATISDPAAYKFATGAKTSWVHKFLDLSVPITDSFTGPAGTLLAGRVTEGQALTWEVDADTAQLTLTGSGSASAPAVGTRSANILRPAKTKVEVSFDYSNLGTRLDVGFISGTVSSGRQLLLAAAVLENKNIALFANKAVAVETGAVSTRTSGRVRFRYDGADVSLWVDDTLVGTKTGVGPITLTPFMVESRMVATTTNATQISNLSIRYL